MESNSRSNAVVFIVKPLHCTLFAKLWGVCSTDNFLSPLFSVPLKVSVMLHYGSVRRVHSKQCYFIFSWHFFVVFNQKICFYHFHFFSWWSVEFPQQNINQTETGIGDKNLSPDLYVRDTYKDIVEVRIHVRSWFYLVTNRNSLN